jgi:hypothetical protein
MRELQSLLMKRETAVAVNFDHLNHRIRCYAHIINICSSHIIASVTQTSKSGLSDLEVPIDSNYARDSDDESGDDDIDRFDPIHEFEESELAHFYDDEDNSTLKEWFAGIKRDPLRRARRVIRLLRSSDQRREGFRAFIRDGNQRRWFTTKNNDGKRITVQVPELQPLRDVKTRWDSVYMMLQRLRQLRPVSRLADWTVETS